jgi:hypothetical protein
MAGARGNNALGNNGGRFYSFAHQPVLIDSNFIVDSTNGNGLGIRSLKGQGIQNVFMNTSASFSGTLNSTTLVTGISTGTSSLQVGMPVSGTDIPPGTTIASIASSSSITLSAAATGSATVTISYRGIGNNGVVAPVVNAGYALIQLSNNYEKYLGGFSGFVSPPITTPIAINSTALTIGNPYQIATVGHGTLGAATIAPVADSSGSLAGKYFTVYDNYGNTFVIWFYVTGVGGTAPVISGAQLLGVSTGPGTYLIQQTIAENATADNITTALSATIILLQSGISGVNSFTASGGGGATLTITSTQTNPYSPLPGAPADGPTGSSTGFTFANTVTQTNNQNWATVGLPAGVLPNVNASFVAAATGASTGGGSTGTVFAPSISGITSVEVIGDPNQSIAPVPVGGTPHTGAWILVQLLAPTSTSTTTLVPTAPANNSTVGMDFYMSLRV